MSEDRKFTVHKLLTDYRKRVEEGEIVFLQGNPTAKKKIVIDLEELQDHFPKTSKKEREWHKVHEIVERLWQNLTSCAINSIDPNSKGNSKLFKYLKEATKFEDLLYGLEDYYRDHTLHSLWVYLIGDNLLSGDLIDIYRKPNWYLFNDIKKDEKKSNYAKDLVEYSEGKKTNVCEKVNEYKDAIWCIIALCHDLGYSLAKLDNLNERVQKVLKFFDVPDFRHVGYSLDIEHQYLVQQFLELMAMDVRIVPSEDFREMHEIRKKRKEKTYKERLENKEYSRRLEETTLIKCYRDDSTYWRLCRAMEKKEHGILSAYLIYKVLGIFAESSVRGPAEEWGLNNIEAKRNIIRGDILFAIVQHEFDFAHLNELGSFADILIIADELEEFSRFGRPLLSRKYNETTALTSISFKNSRGANKVELGKIAKIEMVYASKHDKREGFRYFFYRKATKLCSIYSLKPSQEEIEEEKEEKENYCTITGIKMTVNWKGPSDNENPLREYWLAFSKYTNIVKGRLPKCEVSDKEKYNVPKKRGYAKGIYKLRSYDDELRVIGKSGKGKRDFEKEIPLKEWLGIPDEKN